MKKNFTLILVALLAMVGLKAQAAMYLVGDAFNGWNTSGNVVQYKVEITSVENPELKDTIYISVESTPKPETTEQTTTSEENNTEAPATDAGGGQTPADQGETP